MKFLKVVKKVLIGILAVVFFTFAIAMTILLLNFNDYRVTQIGDTSVVIIGSTISSDKYKKGDVVLVEQKKIDEINVGDEIFAYKVKKDRTVDIELGTVGEVYQKDEALTFENGDNYTMDYVIGTGGKVYNKIGTYLSVIESKWGFLFMILVPSFLIFIYQLYALIIEIKYGKDDEPQKSTH